MARPSSIFKRLINILPYTIVIGSITGPWFFQSGYLFFVDLVWGPHLVTDPADHWFFLYTAANALAPFLSAPFIQKVWLTCGIALVLFGGKKIAEQFVSAPFFIFVAALFALSNPFVYERFVYGQIGVVAGTGLCLLATGFGIEWAKNYEWRPALIAGVSLACAWQVLPHMILLCFPIVCVFLWVLFRKPSKKVLFQIITIGVILLGLNAHWLFGFVSQTSFVHEMIDQRIVRDDVVRFSGAGATFWENTQNQVKLTGFWALHNGRFQDLRTLGGWGRAFWFTLPVVVYGVYVGCRSKTHRQLTVGFVLAGGCAFFLAYGVHAPGVREATFWMFDHITPYRGLRETNKWLLVVLVGYVVFFSLGLRNFSERTIVKQYGKIIAAIFAIFVVMQAPFLFHVSNQVRAVTYPDDWYAVDTYLVKNTKCTETILFFPWHAYMSFEFVGRIVASPAEPFFTCPVMRSDDPELDAVYDGREDQQRRAIHAWIEAGGGMSQTTTLPFDTAVILLAKEVDWQEYVWLDSHAHLQLLIETEHFRVYQYSQSL